MNMIEDEKYENCHGSFITKPKQLEICKDINQNFTGFIGQDSCSLCEYEAQVEDQIKAVYCTQVCFRLFFTKCVNYIAYNPCAFFSSCKTVGS